MQAVILAGGKGTRLGPITDHLPKPMVRVAGQPFLYWQLQYLREQGVREVLLLVSHLGEQIISHFTIHPVSGLSIAFSEEVQPMGTGGALRQALPKLAPTFWLLNGDSFLRLDLSTMTKDLQHSNWRACIAALTKPELVPVPANMKIEENLVLSFKKGAGREEGFTAVDAGIYWLNRNVIENGPSGVFSLEDYWPDLIQSRELGAYRVVDRFYDIGTPERLKDFEEYINDHC